MLGLRTKGAFWGHPGLAFRYTFNRLKPAFRLKRCSMTRFAAGLLVVAFVLSTARVAYADDMQEVMRLWCTQVGTWAGKIDVTGPDGKATQFELVTTHDCTENGAHHIVRERFGSGLSTVKVTFIDRAAKNFQTAYFAGGKQAPYSFDFVSVESTDDKHWKTIIASTPGTEQYEGKPAILRYIRVRNGDTIESWKDVQFPDGKADYEPRSRIVQTLRP